MSGERSGFRAYIHCTEHGLDLTECFGRHGATDCLGHEVLKRQTESWGVHLEMLGQLDARDLGKRISISNGGATYTGQLTSVHHINDGSADVKARTHVILHAGRWSHNAVYDSAYPFEWVK